MHAFTEVILYLTRPAGGLYLEGKDTVNYCMAACHNNLLTPWSRILLEKQPVNFAASQEIPRIYGTRKFLTVPTSARHLSLF
jgi:hypothetical protein